MIPHQEFLNSPPLCGAGCGTPGGGGGLGRRYGEGLNMEPALWNKIIYKWRHVILT